MTEFKIKENDLYAITKDLMNAALVIDRPNKGKICNFVVALVENGGHITNAAMLAGYGPPKTKDGKVYTEAERRKLAGNEGSRLLENAGISGLYEKLMWHRCVADNFTKSFSRNYSAALMFQAYQMNINKNPSQAIKALKEASILVGHYLIAEKKPLDLDEDQQNELIESPLLLKMIMKENRKYRDAPISPKPISSEVYD